MKYLNKTALLLVVSLTALLASGCEFISSESGGYMDANTKLLKPDAAGRIESAGADLRVYEFTPQTALGKQCVFVAGRRKSGLFCFDKEGS